MKSVAILFLLTLSALLFVSCNDEQADKTDIIQNLEQKVQQITVSDDQQFEYQKELTPWYTPEVEYKYDPNGDNSDGIEWISRFEFGSYTLEDGQLRFLAKYLLGGISEITMYTYLDIKTGEISYLCPNPLCSHRIEDGCLFVNLNGYERKDNYVYTVKYLYKGKYTHNTIVEIDIEQNTMRELFQCDNEYDYLSITSLKDDIIYFQYFEETERTENEDGQINTNVEMREMYLDLKTGKSGISEKSTSEDNDYYILYQTEDWIYFKDEKNNRIMVADKDCSKKKVLITYEPEYRVSSILYDSFTEELYLSISSDDIIMDSLDHLDIEKGDIYVIDKDNKARKIEMPSDKIRGFQLTRNYIYYTVYDPLYYGTSIRGFDCVRQDGGKIYRVSRDDTTSPELVFDAHEVLFPGSYIVLGDYIYIDYSELISGGGYSYFRRVGSTARIHMENQTIKWLNFD